VQNNIDSTWGIENAFHQKVKSDRWEKYLSQYEAVKLCTKGVRGCVVEVGVHKMNSMVRLHAFHKALGFDPTFVGFDMFDNFVVSNPETALASDFKFVEEFEEKTGGALSLEDAEEVARYHSISNIRLVKGDVFDTIPQSMNYLSEGIRFLHIDVDVFPATYFSLKRLIPVCNPGAIVLLDDYGHVEGATKAVDQFLAENPGRYVLRRLGFSRPVYYFCV